MQTGLNKLIKKCAKNDRKAQKEIYQLFAGNPFPAHLHSLFWFLLLSVVVAKLMQRTISAEKSLLILFMAIFLWDGQHVATMGWVANRNALIACFFAMSSLYLHILWREEQKVHYFLLAMAALVFALLSAEVAVSIGVFLFFYSILLDPRGAKQGFISLLPYLLIVVVWFCVL